MEHHYTYRVEWSDERYEYTARCLEIRGLWVAAPTAQQALAMIEAEVEQNLRSNEELGLPLPTPLTEQNFSGRFMVRTSPSLHARLMVEATEQGVSLNQWVVQKLVDRRPSLDW
ncbi:toxin-antitoxin system HicB family antitoxin [Mycolicibacterium sp. GF69]|uniref:type II toxin-antitoxin system HicB family antitoxin n=1 Tax=Mycolicibacterium sp. GF69 TaxID=2267251 RepID=UPI000DCDD9EA|nr:type II toxin-antitoxin system HicB family antitoxin [Mycolicibacterium sp. GF69]RAV06250.1 toxin-antitoxin system HicB family antitoxin [Mycolicibacterium sp. GF69]